MLLAKGGTIRSGWCALLFIAFYVALSNLSEMLLSHLVQLETHGPLSAGHVFAEESCDVLAVLSAAWIMARIEGRSLLSFGYSDERFARRLAARAFCGLLSLTCLVGILWKAHLLVFSGLSMTGMVAWKSAFEWAFAALLIGILEESLLRGYLQFTLTRALGFRISVISNSGSHDTAQSSWKVPFARLASEGSPQLIPSSLSRCSR